MPNPASELRAFLLGDAAIAAAVGSGSDARVYWNNAPQTAARPYIVIANIAQTNTIATDGVCERLHSIEVSVVHDVAQGGSDLADAVGNRIELGSTDTVQLYTLEDRTEVGSKDDSAADRNLIRTILTFGAIE
jgi:hypothetical protein